MDWGTHSFKQHRRAHLRRMHVVSSALMCRVSHVMTSVFTLIRANTLHYLWGWILSTRQDRTESARPSADRQSDWFNQWSVVQYNLSNQTLNPLNEIISFLHIIIFFHPFSAGCCVIIPMWFTQPGSLFSKCLLEAEKATSCSTCYISLFKNEQKASS